MITESAFVGAEGLPQEMADALDVAWHFLGEVAPMFMSDGGIGPYLMRTPCHHGKHELPCDGGMAGSLPPDARIYCVDLWSYLFVTDDMIEVRVYFGRCGDCGRVYWARQGPPFRRVRAAVLV